MTTVEKLKELNCIEREEFDKLTDVLFQSMIVPENHSTKISLDKKEEIISYFNEFLKKMLEVQFLKSKKHKLEFIDMIDKLNMQLELVDLKKNNAEIRKIKKAGRSLAKKSQSSVV